MLRPLLEIIEVLTYFRLDPERANIAIEGALPNPGKIGQTIAGEFQFLREYLNKEASHFSFSHSAMVGLLEKETMKFNSHPTHSQEALRMNLEVLSELAAFLLYEMTTSLVVAEVDGNGFTDRIEDWNGKREVLFLPPIKRPP